MPTDTTSCLLLATRHQADEKEQHCGNNNAYHILVLKDVKYAGK
jgi:hypothetical protein